MAVFRFRGAAALELRRRQEDAAAAAFARMEAQFRETTEALHAVEQQRSRAQSEQLARSAQGIGIAALLWHRNWISRLQAAADDLRADVRTKAAAADAAKRAWQAARRRRLALDRMRERAVARHRAAEQLQERRVMDELARIRFVMPDTLDGGMTDGD